MVAGHVFFLLVLTHERFRILWSSLVHLCGVPQVTLKADPLSFCDSVTFRKMQAKS